MGTKAPEAFRTISEVSDILETPPHVLRFWESKFSQLKPVKRAGGRRYYRPADMELLGGIKRLLHDEGMTIRGVQKMLREQGVKHVAAFAPAVNLEAAGTVVLEDGPSPIAEPATTNDVLPVPPRDTGSATTAAGGEEGEDVFAAAAKDEVGGRMSTADEAPSAAHATPPSDETGATPDAGHSAGSEREPDETEEDVEGLIRDLFAERSVEATAAADSGAGKGSEGKASPTAPGPGEAAAAEPEAVEGASQAQGDAPDATRPEHSGSSRQDAEDGGEPTPVHDAGGQATPSEGQDGQEDRDEEDEQPVTTLLRQTRGPVPVDRAEALRRLGERMAALHGRMAAADKQLAR